MYTIVLQRYIEGIGYINYNITYHICTDFIFDLTFFSRVYIRSFYFFHKKFE